jgi:hypothetical protein
LGPKYFTPEQQTRIFGGVCVGVLAATAGGALFMLLYGWKKRVVIMVGYYGSPSGGNVWPRDAQPVKYWGGMLFYFCAFIVFSFVALLLLQDIL